MSGGEQFRSRTWVEYGNFSLPDQERDNERKRTKWAVIVLPVCCIAFFSFICWRFKGNQQPPYYLYPFLGAEWFWHIITTRGLWDRWTLTLLQWFALSFVASACLYGVFARQPKRRALIERVQGSSRFANREELVSAGLLSAKAKATLYQKFCKIIDRVKMAVATLSDSKHTPSFTLRVLKSVYELSSAKFKRRCKQIGKAYRIFSGQDSGKDFLHRAPDGCKAFKEAFKHKKPAPVTPDDGVIVGGWKNPANGTLEYLVHKGPEHVLAVAPTGSGKGINLVVPTLLTWRESCFVTDIKGENFLLTAGYREKVLHQKVYKFEPTDKTHAFAQYNPLQEVTLTEEAYMIAVTPLISEMTNDEITGLSAVWKDLTGADIDKLKEYKQAFIAYEVEKRKFMSAQKETERGGAVGADTPAAGSGAAGATPDTPSSMPKPPECPKLSVQIPLMADGAFKFSQHEAITLKRLREDGTTMTTETAEIQQIALTLADPDGRGLNDGQEAHWKMAAFNLLVGIITHVLYKGRREGKIASIGDVRAALQDANSKSMAKKMMVYKHMRDPMNPQNWICHPVVKSAAQELFVKDEKEASSIISTASTGLGLWDDENVQWNTARSSFTISDLVNQDDPATLYLVIPPVDLIRLVPLIRLFMSLLCSRLTQTMKIDLEKLKIKSPNKHRLLIMADEFAAYKKLEQIEKGMAYFRGYGILLYIIIQSYNQMFQNYGKDEMISGNCHIHTAFAPNDLETAKTLSARCGKTTAIIGSSNISGKRFALYRSQDSISYRETSVDLMTPNDVMALPKAKVVNGLVQEAGDMIAFAAGCSPIYGKQMPYFMDDEMAARIMPPPDGKCKAYFTDTSRWDKGPKQTEYNKICDEEKFERANEADSGQGDRGGAENLYTPDNASNYEAALQKAAHEQWEANSSFTEYPEDVAPTDC